MIRLIYSNRTERLLGALAQDLDRRRDAGVSPLEPVELVVPNRNMETYVSLGLAQVRGVAANLRFRRLERFAGELVAGLGGPRRLADRSTLEAHLLSLLLDDAALAAPDLAPVRSYLEGSADPDGRDLRRVQLAERLASLFEAYGYSRPEMLEAWRRGPTLDDPELGSIEGWQRGLWLRLFAPGGRLEAHPPGPGLEWATLEGILADPRGEAPQGTFHVFGVSYVARVFQRVFAWVGGHADVHLYTLNPCMEFWEDVATDGELRARLRARSRGRVEHPDVSDPFGLADADTPALRLWGRPGRENVHLLDELTGCDFDARFAEPEGESLLSALQRDILRREPERPSPSCGERAGDGSLVLIEAPGVRREAQAVADEIWRLLRTPPGEGELPLRFSDIAVIVNAADRDLYLPHLEAAFDEAHRLPRSVVDLPMTGTSRIAEAALLLFNLPFGRFTRREVLDVLLHPAFLGRWDDADPEAWAGLADRLGIYFGIDREDLAGTYVQKDLLSWDQGLRRLVLGAYMTGPASGDDRIVGLAGERYLPEELAPGRLLDAARFGLSARALLSEARAHRSDRMPLGDWAARFRRQLQTWLYAADERDAGDRQRCLEALESLRALDLDGRPVSGRLASVLASRALAGLSSSRGAYLAEGVVVSTFMPMRAIPFRAVFVLGLGEGRFPAAGRLDPLDLRAAGRRPGDVTPAERDRYTFLETLMSTRERLYLSWVGRDEQTGDPLQASAVIQELTDLLETGYVGKEGLEALRRRVPLRRFAEAPASLAPSAAPMALLERSARGLGEALRAATGRGDAGEQPAALAALLGAEGWARLARLLALPLSPLPADDAAPEVLRLSLSQLRRFLECPMQGAAAALLGLSSDDEDPAAEREDEPFELPHLEKVVSLRELFLRGGGRGAAPELAYAEAAERLELAGRLPTGVLGDLDRERHLGVLRGWQALVERALGEAPGFRRIGFGRALEDAEVDTPRPPLELTVELPAGRVVRVELSGRTEALAGEPGASLVLGLRPGGQKPAVLKQALRGLVDHLALAAAGLADPAGHRVVVCAASSEEDLGAWGVRLPGLTPDEARARLGALVGELLAGPHDYLLPCEAVLGAWSSGDGALPDGESLVQEVRRLLANDRASYSSRYGPVPHPERQRIPEPADAEAMVRRRFLPFLQGLTWEGKL